jgi:hypothetical protein
MRPCSAGRVQRRLIEAANWQARALGSRLSHSIGNQMGSPPVPPSEVRNTEECGPAEKLFSYPSLYSVHIRMRYEAEQAAFDQFRNEVPDWGWDRIA